MRGRRFAAVAVPLALLASLLPAGASALSEERGWEMVSPIDKNGGAIPPPEQIFHGGAFQAAADGESVAYSSASSFASGSASAPPGSQYVAARGDAIWSTLNLNVPIFSGSFGPEPDGTPYQLFSEDLSRALLLNGQRCRGVEAACPVVNPPLPGTDAPAGYQDYYLRSEAGFEPLIGAGDVANTAVGPAHFEVRLAGANADLTAVILETCAALTPDATEVALGEGCDPAESNLYEWAAGSLTLVNSEPGAELAAQSGAISASGSRVYFIDANGGLYLKEGTQRKLVREEGLAPPVSFQVASGDGSVAYYLWDGRVRRYTTATGNSTPISDEAQNALGVLGATPDGGRVYYLTDDGLYTWTEGTATKIAAGVDASNYPPVVGTARVSADNGRLIFLSTTPLTSYNNTDQKTGLPDSEIYIYDPATTSLRCVSCRSNGLKPIGPSTIPGAYANGKAADATRSYKPRAFAADGNHVFFNSEDALVGADVNKEPDVYEWRRFGNGCTKPSGCSELISSGRSPDGAVLIDASTSGNDVFFVTDGSLVETDPGAYDLYDARLKGGTEEEPAEIACEGDACEELPGEPVDPALNTLVGGPGNPKVRYYKYRRRAERCRGSAKARRKCKKQQTHRGKKGRKR